MTVARGRLYLADLRPGFGSEPGKLRPVLVIQTDLLNAVGHPSTWILPCTTRCIGSDLLRVVIAAGVAGNDRDCEILIDQSRAIDNARFRQELGALPAELLAEVCSKLRLLGGL